MTLASHATKYLFYGITKMNKTEFLAKMNEAGLNRKHLHFLGGGINVEINESQVSFKSANPSALGTIVKLLGESNKMINGSTLIYTLQETSITPEEITDGDLENLKSYFGSFYRDINRLNRFGINQNDAARRDKSIQKFFTKRVTQSVLYRGISSIGDLFLKSEREIWESPNVIDINELVGKKFTEKSYMSATWDKNVAIHYSGRETSQGGVLIMRMNKPIKALDRAAITNYNGNEKEILLEKGITFKITKVEKRPNNAYVEIYVDIA